MIKSTLTFGRYVWTIDADVAKFFEYSNSLHVGLRKRAFFLDKLLLLVLPHPGRITAEKHL